MASATAPAVADKAPSASTRRVGRCTFMTDTAVALRYRAKATYLTEGNEELARLDARVKALTIAVCAILETGGAIRNVSSTPLR